MTHRVGTKGQVVIPKACRELLGLQPGIPVEFEVCGDELVLRRAPELQSLKGSLRGGPNMAQALLDDRAREPR